MLRIAGSIADVLFFDKPPASSLEMPVYSRLVGGAGPCFQKQVEHTDKCTEIVRLTKGPAKAVARSLSPLCSPASALLAHLRLSGYNSGLRLSTSMILLAMPIYPSLV